MTNVGLLLDFLQLQILPIFERMRRQKGQKRTAKTNKNWPNTENTIFSPCQKSALFFVGTGVVCCRKGEGKMLGVTRRTAEFRGTND